MLPKAEERKSDLRNTTVMEVILAVIIVLLFVIFDNNMAFKTMEENKNQAIKRLELENKDLKTENRKLSLELKTKEQEIKDLKDEIALLEKFISGSSDVKQLIEVLSLENKRLEDLIRKLRAEIESLKVSTGQEKDALRKENILLKAQIKKLEAEIKTLKNRLGVLGGKSGTVDKLLDELEKENLFLKARVSELELELAKLKQLVSNGNKAKSIQQDEIDRLIAEIKRLELKLKKATAGRGGEDAPRCTINSEKIRYLATIERAPKGLRIKLAGETKAENELLKTIPGVRDLISKKVISFDQFRSNALKTYNWGVKEKPSCRFRVRIIQDGMTLSEVTDIERYFYKLLIKKE